MQSPERAHQIAFISGPIEPGEEYFSAHYAPLIDVAIDSGHSFVMGPAPGIDTMARFYLIKKGVSPSRITVYFAEFQERFMAAEVKSVRAMGINVEVEGLTTSERDAAMTRNSHYDILRYMPVEEQRAFYGSRYYPRISATERNEQRRLKVSPPPPYEA